MIYSLCLNKEYRNIQRGVTMCHLYFATQLHVPFSTFVLSKENNK